MVKITTLLKLCTLSLLEKNTYGYKLMEVLRKSFNIGPSQVYPFLKQLKKEKLISETERIIKSRKARVYKLTRKGKKLLLLLTKKIEMTIDSMIKSKIATCVNCGCMIYRNPYPLNIKNKKLKFCCKHCAKNYITK